MDEDITEILQQLNKPAITLSEGVLILRGIWPSNILEGSGSVVEYAQAYVIYHWAVRSIHGKKLVAEQEITNLNGAPITRYWVAPDTFLLWVFKEHFRFAGGIIAEHVRWPLVDLIEGGGEDDKTGVFPLISRFLVENDPDVREMVLNHHKHGDPIEGRLISRALKSHIDLSLVVERYLKRGAGSLGNRHGSLLKGIKNHLKRLNKQTLTGKNFSCT